MKRILSFVAALAAAVSCTMEIAVTPVPGEVKMVEMDFSSEVTKTSLAEANAVNWEESDQIAIFTDKTEDPCLYTIKTCSGSHATFTGSVPDGSTEFYALYPHQAGSICIDGSFVANLPADQSATAGDVSAALMVAYTTGNSFTFKNAVSLIKFTLAEAGVSMITLTSDGGENIAGDLEFDFDHEARTISLTSASEPSVSIVSNDELAQTTYYLAVAPANLASGFTITMYDDQPNEIGSMVFGPKNLVAGKMYNAGTLTTEGAYVDPHKDDTGWYRVMDTRALRAGDVIRIGCASANAVAGAIESGNDYMTLRTAEYNSEQMTAVVSPENFTLSGDPRAWTLTSTNGVLGATAVKKLTYDDTKKNFVGTWTIAIAADGKASIAPAADEYGRILCNSTSTPRFLTYASDPNSTGTMTLPGIYKKYGNPTDGVIKQNQTVKFSPLSYTATIGAENTYPVLTCQSTGAKTWSSSNTAVATIDAATGDITLVAEGTTTISVVVAEDADYKEGSASYELTVNPAPVSVGGTWVRVTDASELGVGDEVVIASTNGDYVMGEAKSSNYSAVAVTSVSNDKSTITFGTDALQFTLVAGTVANSLAFSYDDNGTTKYLCAASSSSNNLKQQTTLNKEGSWSITYSDGVANVVAQGDFTRKYMNYNPNNGSPMFNCYSANSQTRVSIYKKDDGVAKYTVSCASVTGGTLAASPARCAAGTTVTLNATPSAEYTFNNDWSVKGAGNSDITVTANTFTMPEQNVTVTASFTVKTYAITKTAAEHGSFTVKVDDVEVATATKGTRVTLAAEPADGYNFDGFTVKETVSNNTVTVSANSFTMPGAAVTVTAAFSAVPVPPSFDGSGTEADPYTVEDLIKLAESLASGGVTTESYYGVGIISSITEVSTQFGNATYVIKDKNDPAKTFTVFRGKYLAEASFTSENQIAVGDEVVVYGKVKNHNGTTLEFDAGNYIVSIVKAPYLRATASRTTGIPAAGETITVTVETNVAGWTATSSDNTNFAIANKTANSFQVVVAENTSTESGRNATITVSAAGVPNVVINLSQLKSTAGKTTTEATIRFGTNDVKINAASVSGDDNQGNQWTITTVGTSSFTTNSAYYQVGSSSKPATSITFTTTLPSTADNIKLEAKFGGFSGTAGNVALKVGSTTIGSGSLNAANDVVVTSTSNTESGTVLTVTVTNIAKGVKCYYIKATYDI